MPDPLTVFERFESNRRPVPDRTGEPVHARRCEKPAPRCAGVHLGVEELMLLCACVAAVAAASFFLGWYSRGRPPAPAPEPVRERVESCSLEDLGRAFEPVPARYGLSAGVYATEREARARASYFAARGLKLCVLSGEEGLTVVVGEFVDPSEARLSPLSQEIRNSTPVRLP